MKNRAIFALFIVGFCIIFLGSILALGAQVHRRQAEIDSMYRGASEADTANKLHIALVLTILGHLFVTLGSFPLVVASAVGAWTIEDKYVKLGMLIFCALITTFLLAPSIITLTI